MARLTNSEKLRRYREKLRLLGVRKISDRNVATPSIGTTPSGVPYYLDRHGIRLSYIGFQHGVSD